MKIPTADEEDPKGLPIGPRPKRDLFAPLTNQGVVHKTLRGGIYSLGSQAVNFCIGILTIAILARFLSPSDYGIFAILFIFISFFSVFLNFGLVESVLQSKIITRGDSSSLFWLNVVFGTAMSALCIAIAPIVGWFFSDSRLIPALSIIGLYFVIGSFGTQHRALLQRSMDYAATARCDIAGQLLGLPVGVVLAMNGAGYWSLVALQLSSAFVMTAGLILTTRWIPGRPAINQRVRSLVGIGANVTGFQVLNFFGANTDNILVGRFVGVFQLGLYSRAYNLLIVPVLQLITPLTNVMVGALTRIGAENDAEFGTAFRSIASKLNIVVIPLTVFFMINAHQIIRIVLGPRWDQAANIYFVLGFGGLAEPIIVMVGWLLIAEGRSRDYLYIGALRVPVMLAGFAVGVQFGTIGVAAAYSIVTCVALLPILWFAGRTGPVSATVLLGTCQHGILLGLVTAASAGAALYLVHPGPALVDLAISFTASVVSNGLCLVLIPSIRREVADIRAAFRDHFHQRPATRSQPL